MKQKSRIASKLFAVLVVLTLISCCFLGTTFARYTSGQSGDASVGVAVWDIGTSKGGDLNITADKLSPSVEEFIKEEHNTEPRENSLTNGITQLVTITNNSDVDALVTVTIGKLTYAWQDGKATGFVTSEQAYSWSNGNLNGTGVSKEQADAVLTIKFYWDASGADEITEEPKRLSAKTSDPAASCSIYYEVTWTSYDADAETADLPDAIDTWLGENLASIGCKISYTAVQASEQPNT